MSIDSEGKASPMTILCLASYFKGVEFMRECKRQGCRVLLLTSQSLTNADWPRESLDDVFYMPDENKKWRVGDAILGVSHLAKSEVMDRIVPLDDFDLETAAALREHLRVPGMGETTTRYFRDKLAMRARAQDAGLPVPEFVHVLNRAKIAEFVERVPAPWVLKPRSQAGAIGIKKIGSEAELYSALERLGDEQSFYLLEQYVPGDIYHVDTIWFEKKLLFTSVSRYGTPPMDVSHGGGVFTTKTLAPDSPEARELSALNERVLSAFGFVRGVSHSEFIQGLDGKCYFLETSARVGGAHIAELVEAATGVNMWGEWAKVEIAGEKGKYQPPQRKTDFAGLMISLARDEWPDTSSFQDREVVFRLKQPFHVGMIVKSEKAARVDELVSQYAERIRQEYSTSAPAPDRPTH
jgi:biotin carboxylase